MARELIDSRFESRWHNDQREDDDCVREDEAGDPLETQKSTVVSNLPEEGEDTLPEDLTNEDTVSRLTTELYTISYLIFFSFLGTLARLGLGKLTFYPGAAVMFPSAWYNFAGSLFLGFLAEDRKLLLYELRTATYELQDCPAWEQSHHDRATLAQQRREADLAAAKKAHLATKKTVPLYIGLATGFGGSFTSFSAFIRDAFLALSNDLPDPYLSGITTVTRNGGYSFMSLLAVIITTLSVSLGGLVVGSHLALALEPILPSLSPRLRRELLDPFTVVFALGGWIAVLVLCILPPDRHTNPDASETWRGSALFALALAPVGCLMRFYVSLYLNPYTPNFPLGTFAVNIFGVAVLAMGWDLGHVQYLFGQGEGEVIACQVLQGLQDGFCGCLTTVSTWVAELAGMKRRREAWIYGAVSVLAALAIMVAVMGSLRWTRGFDSLVCVSKS